MTVDNLLTERFSRNEVLVRVLSDMGFVERLGYGLDRLVRRMAEEGLPPPQFEETAAGFKVTLFNRPAAQLTGQTNEQPTQRWLALGLFQRQIKAMSFTLEHGRIALSDFGQLCPDEGDVLHECEWGYGKILPQVGTVGEISIHFLRSLLETGGTASFRIGSAHLHGDRIDSVLRQPVI